jgi:hypothetical protein
LQAAEVDEKGDYSEKNALLITNPGKTNKNFQKVFQCAKFYFYFSGGFEVSGGDHQGRQWEATARRLEAVEAELRVEVAARAACEREAAEWGRQVALLQAQLTEAATLLEDAPDRLHARLRHQQLLQQVFLTSLPPLLANFAQIIQLILYLFRLVCSAFDVADFCEVGIEFFYYSYCLFFLQVLHNCLNIKIQLFKKTLISHQNLPPFFFVALAIFVISRICISA